MHLEAVIERVWRCTWRLSSSKFGDMHLGSMIVRTWRPKSSKFEDPLGGRDCARLDEYLEAVDGRRVRLYSSVSSLATLGM